MLIKTKIDDIFVFDLDRTIWDCYDKYDNLIWAKQLIQPFTLLDENIILDDCGSKCVLQDGFRNFLKNINQKIVYLSNGGILNLDLEKQPSIKLLKLFGLCDIFALESLLTYKVFSKEDYFLENKNYIFFDDDDKHILNVSKKKNVLVYDRKKMEKSWNSIKIIN